MKKLSSGEILKPENLLDGLYGIVGEVKEFIDSKENKTFECKEFTDVDSGEINYLPSGFFFDKNINPLPAGSPIFIKFKEKRDIKNGQRKMNVYEALLFESEVELQEHKAMTAGTKGTEQPEPEQKKQERKKSR